MNVLCKQLVQLKNKFSSLKHVNFLRLQFPSDANKTRARTDASAYFYQLTTIAWDEEMFYDKKEGC